MTLRDLVLSFFYGRLFDKISNKEALLIFLGCVAGVTAILSLFPLLGTLYLATH